MTRIVLRIDRLTLRGVERADATALAAALQAELRELLLRHPAAALAATPDAVYLAGGKTSVAAPGPAAVGRAVAGRIGALALRRGLR